MAGPIQMAADVFWAQIQNLETLSSRLKSDLAADRLKLMALYSVTRKDPNPKRAAANQALLQPQIHRNSVLRMRYAGLAAAFNKAVDAARGTLKRAGYAVPRNLDGLGGPIYVGALAVAAVATAFLIYQSIRTATDAQRRQTGIIERVINDPTLTPEQRIAELVGVKEAAAAARPLFNFDLGQMVPILGLIALIAIGPSLLPRRGAA